MAELTRKERFAERYGQVEKIWSGDSFIKYLQQLRPLLEELPVSEVAIPNKDYGHVYKGNLDNVFGEVISIVTSYEGYLKDKAFPIMECVIRPILGTEKTILEFIIHYKQNGREEAARTYEVMRNGERSFIFFSDRYRPS
jgi:hypothetical protein